MTYRACALALVLPLLGGCTVLAITSSVVGGGVALASTAVDGVVIVGKGVVSAGSAVGNTVLGGASK